MSISSEIRARHQAERDGALDWCTGCGYGIRFPCDAIRAADELAAAEKLAQAVEVLSEAMYSDDKGAAYEALWSALARYRELCPVTAQEEEAAPVPPLEDDPFPGYLGAASLRAVTEWKARQARREAEYEPPRPLDEPAAHPVGTLRRRGRSQQPASAD